MNKRLLTEPFFSCDVESNGPCPLKHSLLSVGLRPFTLQDGLLPQRFSVNLQLLENGEVDPETQKFWDANPEAYAASRLPELLSPRDAMWEMARFVADVAGKRTPVFAAYPAGYDYTFIYVHCHYFLGFNPFKWSAWDGKSYAMAAMKSSFRDTVKSNMPEDWFPPRNEGRAHIAIDDADAQAVLFINMLCEHNGLPNPLHKDPTDD